MKSSTSQRLQDMINLLQEKSFVKAKDLAKRYQVSMETIRKDLLYLEEKGIAKKEYGGASLSLLGVEREITYRKYHEDEKREIARYVSDILRENHSLILDSGSTCQACVEYINLLPEMDIITNSIDSCKQINAHRHHIFMLPGRKRAKSDSVIGNWTEDYLKKVQVDICLLGTSGLLDSEGPTAHSYQELSTKQAMIEQSDLVFVLADSSKFHEKGLHTVVTWDKIDGVITDHLLSPKIYNQYCQQVPLYIAKDEKLSGQE